MPIASFRMIDLDIKLIFALREEMVSFTYFDRSCIRIVRGVAFAIDLQIVWHNRK